MHRQRRGTRTFLCALSALVLLLVGLDAAAQLGLGFSNPTLLAGTGRNRSPVAATDGAGHWLVAWDHSDVIGSGQEDDIYVVRSTNNGLTWTTAVPLNINASSDTGLDWWPDLAADGNGHWVAVWRSNDSLGGTLGSDFDILVATSNDNGLSWTSPAPLYTAAATDTTDEWWPRIATDSLGHWVVVWDGEDVSGDSDVFAASSSDNGATWTPPLPLNSNAATDTAWDTEVHVAADRLGHWVAVWESRTPEGGPYGTDDDLYVARSTDNGITWTPPAVLNTNAAADSDRDIAPDLATDRAGHWVVVWDSNDDHAGTLGTDYDILVACSDDNGATWSDPAPLNTYAANDIGNDWFPRLTTDGAGRWMTTWSFDPDNNGSLGAPPVGYLATSNDNGATWSYPVLLSEGSTPDGWNPYLATDGVGHWVATWMSLGGGTQDFAIYAASLDASTDTDWDGLSNNEETRDLDPLTPGIQNPFDPAVYDSTGDDGSTVPDGIRDRDNDWDGDGVTNGREFTFGSNPADPNDTVDLPQAQGPALGLLALSLSLAAARTLRKRGTP